MLSSTTEPVGREAARPDAGADANALAWRRVFELAGRGRFSTAPNPRVGAVVLDAKGAIVGEGFHERAGLPHAEVVALREAGGKARGGTVLVNLEPCAHHGRTPPCAAALAEAGIARVCCSLLDPDPRTSGRGVAFLRERGIEIEVGAEAAQAERLNEHFLVSARKGRPFVHLKWASSLDGKLATRDGVSRWVSGEAAREDSMTLREEHDAILVGARTVVADDPRLTRRLGRNTAVTPHRRIVLDGRLRVLPSARVFARDEAGEAWLVTAFPAEDPALSSYREAGVHVESFPCADEKVDFPLFLGALQALEVRSLLVEGGGQTAFSFLSCGLVDRVTIYLAPSLIGGDGAPSSVSGDGFRDLSRLPRVLSPELSWLGDDLRITGLVDFGKE